MSVRRRNEVPVPQHTTTNPPGVYVYEVSSGIRPIQAVGSSTAGFVGAAPHKAAHLNKAIVVNNWSEFRDGFMIETNTTASPPTVTNHDWNNLAHAVFGFFQNGGSRCWIVNVGGEDGSQTALTDAAGNTGLDVLAQIDEVAIVAAPGYTDDTAHNAILAHCESAGDRIGILDIKKEPAAGAAWTATEVNKIATDHLKVNRPANGIVTTYFPWLKVADPANPRTGTPVVVPPSGHVAGVWARTDNSRGVHKAPANEPLNGIIGLDFHVTDQTNAALNNAGINVIRFFSGEGYKVWGARTLASDSEWRYLNVRRLLTNLEESIAKGTRWIVFEPNNEELWRMIRRDVGAFLTDFWRAGALMGNSPEEAFYVKCDAENNPLDSIRDGKVIIDIGVAPTYPAEFVIFRIGQYEGGTEVQQFN